MVDRLATVADIRKHLEERYRLEDLAEVKGKPFLIGRVVSDIVTTLHGRVDPFLARTVLLTHLYGADAPKQIIQSTLKELSKMLDVSIDDAELTYKLSFAIDTLQTLVLQLSTVGGQDQTSKP
jgi:hypothetical protein